MRLIAPMIVATLVLSASAQAQVRKDGASTFEPRSAPGVGQKFLETFAGDWEVSKVFYPRTGDPVRTRGTCRQAMIQGGRFLQSDFTFGEGERKTTGMGIIGFEPESGRFTSFWIDSRQTRMSPRRSRAPFDGKTIVLHSLPLDPDAKETRRSRTVTTLEDEGRKLHHRQYVPGDGGEERLIMELIMIRKP